MQSVTEISSDASRRSSEHLKRPSADSQPVPDAAPVLWGYQKFWSDLSSSERTGIIFRSLWDHGLPSLPHDYVLRGVRIHELSPARPLAPSDLPLITVVRNEGKRLLPFLHHYRALGVTRFLVVDDASSDDTRDVLLAEPDVSLFSSNVRYGAARRGMAWRHLLARRFGLNRWYVSVDADELLVYSGMERHPLPDLIARLQSSGQRRAFALMIDLYPEGAIAEAHYNPSKDHPLDVAPMFDGDGYTARFRSRQIDVRGGPRRRLYTSNATLTKFPLLYWDHWTKFSRSVHRPLPYWRNFEPPLVALLHFKVFSDFDLRCSEAVADGQRWRGGADYAHFRAAVGDTTTRSLRYERSRRFLSPQSFVDAGIMRGIDW